MEPDLDEQKRSALRRMKTIALLLLIVAAIVFAISFWLQRQYPWLEYVRAAAEGAMVGALADWFAVTALFRYPMGLRIPHTAIIPTRKDAIGASLGEFVESNFLSEEVVREKLASVGVAQRLGSWLAREESAQRLATEGAAAIKGVLEVLRDEDIREVIESMVRQYILAPPWGPPLGRLAGQVFANGHHRKLVDLLVDRAVDWVEANPSVVSRVVSERSPSWVPGFVDELVGGRVYTEVHKFVLAVQADQQHQVRRALDEYLAKLAEDLQHDPAMIQRAEEVKAQILDSPRVRELAGQTWETVKNALLAAADDPNSALRLKFVSMVRDFGTRLASGEELAEKVNGWVIEVAAYAVRNYRHDIASIITDTVERWDAQEASRKIELQVGRDLQYIRINGTVVGALAGLAIYTVAALAFG
ncbi:uncharacterized membrane-anchored protein YjiN (DUF445 family) [Psychromicrobium silvestre]|uniref:Uncharacterized membrane-anchored protein YjiN (DUF445 family) n=1 Tax=Psychromicrobium silvestre TaxID=1645614 RepID=A0A7Y9S843_9MICC|nr:DUF445 domain-containing protein [Psychromicrobium silvestre]NYE96110.1 uncharacterized membrane-anchored protein YjiN (DUF445 family) [Psychromicrobium silvestre]